MLCTHVANASLDKQQELLDTHQSTTSFVGDLVKGEDAITEIAEFGFCCLLKGSKEASESSERQSVGQRLT